MKLIITILIIISILVLIAGCAQDEGPIEEGVRAFIGGDRGLDLEFTEGAPPDVVYDRDFPFDVNIRVENVGEWDIPNTQDVTLTIIGIESTSFGKSLADLTKNTDIIISPACFGGFRLLGLFDEGLKTN